jgi:hypothetical protein
VFPKSASGNADEVTFLKKEIEKLPRGEVVGRLPPDIGSIYSAKTGESTFLQSLLKELSLF